MGDRRFEPQYRRVAAALLPLEEIRDMTDVDVVEALAAASRANDPYLANVLSTEATNRMHHARVEVESLGEGLCSLDLHGLILTANPAAEEILGRTQRELRGQDFDSLCRDGNVVGPRIPEGAYLASGRSGVVVECDTERFYRRDGTVFDAFYTSAPIMRNGRVEGIVIVFRDISKSKLATTRLRESDARYRSLFENSPDFMFSANMDGLITAASPAAAEMSGFSQPEICGHPFERFVAPEDAEAVRALIAGARDGKAERRPILLMRRDGRSVATSMLAMPVVENGVVVGIYGLAESRGELA